MTEIQICNMALRRLGGDAINSLDENSEGARLCKTFYETSLNTVLRDHRWNFSAARVALAELTGEDGGEYSFVYQLPADCLFVRCLTDDNYDYVIEGRKLLTNMQNAGLIYTQKITDPNLFDPLFVSTLAYRIAAEIAYPLTNSVAKIEAMNALYAKELKNAKLRDANEGRISLENTNIWLKSR